MRAVAPPLQLGERSRSAVSPSASRQVVEAFPYATLGVRPHQPVRASRPISRRQREHALGRWMPTQAEVDRRLAACDLRQGPPVTERSLRAVLGRSAGLLAAVVAGRIRGSSWPLDRWESLRGAPRWVEYNQRFWGAARAEGTSEKPEDYDTAVATCGPKLGEEHAACFAPSARSATALRRRRLLSQDAERATGRD